MPTATFRVLFVFIVLSHDRRRNVHFNVTEHPTENWTTADSRSVSGRQSTVVPDPRSRCDLSKRHGRNYERDGIEEVVTAAALAKCVYGAANRIDSPGAPGSHHRMEREIVVSDSAQLFIMSARARISIGQRCAGAQQVGGLDHRWLKSGLCKIDQTS